MKSKVFFVAVALFAIVGIAMAPAQTKGWASNVHIVFFPGGSAGGPFETVCSTALSRPRRPGMQDRLRVVGLGPAENAPAVPRGGGYAPRRHLHHGSPRRRGLLPSHRGRGKEGDPGHQREHAAGEVRGDSTPRTASGTWAPSCTTRDMTLEIEAVKRFGLKPGDRAMVWGLLSSPGAGRGPRASSTLSRKPADGGLPGDRPRDEQGRPRGHAHLRRVRLLPPDVKASSSTTATSPPSRKA